MSGCRNLLCNLCVGVYMHAYVLPACQLSTQAAVCMWMCASMHGVCVCGRGVCFCSTPASSPFTFSTLTALPLLHYHMRVRSSLKSTLFLSFHRQQGLIIKDPDVLVRVYLKGYWQTSGKDTLSVCGAGFDFESQWSQKRSKIIKPQNNKLNRFLRCSDVW